jgi:serine/threonine-protein kinase
MRTVLAALLSAAITLCMAAPAFADHQDVAVPEVTGRDTAAAKQALEAAGLSVLLVPVAGPAVGRVERQEPLAGTRVPVGAEVLLRYGIALRLETKVPDVRGKRMADVAPELEGAYVLEVELVSLPGMPPGQIVQQTPAPGQALWYRGVLSLRVIQGAEPGTGSVIVPPLVGRPEPEALDQLRALGLNVVVEHVADPSRPPATVLMQDPRSGAELLAGGTVLLRVSAHEGGHEESADVPVPHVVGLEMNAAIQAAQGHGFVPQLKFRPAAGDVPWTCVEQDPAPGTPRLTGSPVLLTIAVPGPAVQQVAVPMLFGLAQPQAAAILAALGLVPKVLEVASGHPVGSVIGHEPAAGTTVAKGSQVVLRVAKAPPGPWNPGTAAVPDLLGLTPAAAWVKVQQAGFMPVSGHQLAPNQPVNAVHAQSPNPGSPLALGSKVRFYVPLAAIVPSVLHKTRGEAIQLLQQAGFNPAPSGPDFGIGTTVVIAQSAPAGVPLARGSKVSFAYKFGGVIVPVKVQVPAVLNTTKQQAAAALQAKDLGVNLVQQGPDLPGPGTKVVQQSIPAGSWVNPGTVVTVTYVEVGPLVQQASVPAVVGMTKAQAKALVESKNLVAVFQGPGGNPTKLRVIIQAPNAGTLLAPGSHVTMVVIPIP